MRNAEIKRKTKETDITLELELDGIGKTEIDTGVGYLDHMLVLFACHGHFDLHVKCKGDTELDDHHSVEDIGICLGLAFDEILGNKAGICRYGSCVLPMDEVLILSAVDFSGRDMLCYSLEIPTEKVGEFDTELIEEFFLGFVRNCKCTLHLRKISGENSHHIIEGAFKSAARTIAQAVRIDRAFEDAIPSTKGSL
ncbi:MAG: imidazoleglycerol-phosphate dehydratase HisB [Eggerthellaceae bacterium]|nr:imidazoleglycerol-phosphate dehydratase HisB [Eggerthellaceae bacterium]